jgi:hypothetical protein
MAKKRIKKPVRRKKESDYPGEMSFRKGLSLNPVAMQVGGSPNNVAYDSPEYRKAYAEGKLVSRLNSDPEDFVRAGTLPAYNFDALQETGRDIKEVYPNFNSLTEEEKRYFRDTSPIGRSIRRKAEKGNKSFTDEVNEFATGMLYQTPMAALQIPQSALIEGVQALRGKDANWQSVYDPYKQRVPSDVWGFETTDDMSWYNPRVIGNFAMDMIADPTNLVGAGFLKSPIKAAIRTTLDPTGLFELTGKGFNQGKKFLVRNTRRQIPGSSNVTPVINTARNLEDLKAAQQFAKQYGYELPANLERIAQSNELTDRTIRGMMNRHNTFVRGVSTNWEELGKRNPEILRHLEGKGFDLSTKEGTKAAAEYMATHIPINTGYGRASLNNEVFDRGMDGLYTSNSIPTAEGYTYGQGYITKVKRPTNYSSSNRQDWISQNNPYYRDEDEFRKLMYPLSDEANYAIHLSKQKSWTPKSFDEKSLKNATPKQKATKEIEYRIEQLKKDISELEPNKDKFIDASEVIYSKKETIKQLENDIKYLDQHGDELLQAPGEFKILRTERSDLPTDPFNFLIAKEGNTKKLTEWLKKQPYQEKMREIDELGESLTKYSWDEQQPIRAKIKDLKDEANVMYNQSVQDYMKVNHPDYDPVNKYAHYIHLGTPGEKILQPIKSWEITPEIWKNKSRRHSNKYSKKFSAMANGGILNMQRFGGNLKFQKGGDYNMQRALELGYTPDETGHYPSVDSETGMWLKSKQHPTAWMEYMQGYALNPENNRRFDVVPNVEGYFGENGDKEPTIVPEGDYRAQAYADSLALYKQGRNRAKLVNSFLKDKGYLTDDEFYNNLYDQSLSPVPFNFEARDRLTELNKEYPSDGRGAKRIGYKVGDIAYTPISRMDDRDYLLFAKPKNIVFEEGSKEAQNE